ncbi:stage II sporulation protein M [Halobacillus litoralis]|uniref:stage II sporulation protein M n=1 Tax=Halobacillus litoralis TaxID=45668 RepID=UPI00273F0C63|nr:stage II sporulation protein M [Halobacillus litoralis]WLR48656.1 stage II sporulation protein M [Halobacillus litoralis]
MNYRSFVKRYREEWRRLEELIQLLHKNRRHWAPKHLEEFQRLYQKITQHLSYSQTYFTEEETTVYLNDLVTKAHNMLYHESTSNWKHLKQMFGSSFITLIGEQWKFVVISMLLFFLGGLAAFLAVYQDPMSLYTILPDSIAQAVDPSRLGSQEGGVNSPIMSAEIMTNNIQVAFLAFAGGVTFGLLTVYLLIYNGIIVGALAALFMVHGKAYDFWAYIVPHGIIELTAIFIAGGAGLLMGYKLWVPGKRTRSYQLKTYAYRSVLLLIGTIPLFIIAGIVEGYITPSNLSLEAKYAFAFITVLGLLAYVIIGKINASKTREVHGS